MDAAANPAWIAISIAMGIPLLTGFFIMLGEMRSGKGATAKRDPAAPILFGIYVLLTLLLVTAAALVASSGMAYVGLVKAVLLLGAAFAVVGMAFGLVRGLRSGRALRTPGQG